MTEIGSDTLGRRLWRPKKGIVLLGTVKGLESDSGLVSECIERFDPEAVGLHISPEELVGLMSVVDGKVKETPMSSYEIVYAKKLSRFGQVQIPSPSLREACISARTKDLEIVTLDMDDEEYARVYTEIIGGLSMIRSSLRLRSINRNKFKQNSPEDFIRAWDKAVNGSRDYRKLENERESYMAGRIMEERRKFSRILCVVEFERAEGINELIQKGV